MAENDVVTIKYNELHEIVQAKSKGNTAPSKTQQRKSRRPPQQIYRPGLSRLSKKGKDQTNSDRQNICSENWDAVIADGEVVITDDENECVSKESSSERDVGSVGENISAVRVSGGTGSDGSSFLACDLHISEDDLDLKRVEGRKRSKRPDIRIYVPRGKLIEQECKKTDEAPEGDAEEVWESDEVLSPTVELQSPLKSAESGASSAPSSPGALTSQAFKGKGHLSQPSQNAVSSDQRKVDKTQFANMQVTVVNVSGNNSAESVRVVHETESGHSEANVSGAKNKKVTNSDTRYQRGNRETKSSVNNETGGKGEIKSSVNETGYNSFPRDRRKDKGNHYRFGKSGSLDTKDGKNANSESANERNCERFYMSKHGNLTLSRTSSANDTPSENEYSQKGTDLRNKAQKSWSANRSRKHSYSSKRRQRTDSVSSEASYSSDLSFEDELEGETRTLDWSQEVERELALVVHNGTQRLIEQCDDAYPGTAAEMEMKIPDDVTASLNVNQNCNAVRNNVRKEHTGRRRHRKKGSRASSRDSSAHSNCQEESTPAPRRGRGRGRRHSADTRRKHHSGDSMGHGRGHMGNGDSYSRQQAFSSYESCAQDQKGYRNRADDRSQGSNFRKPCSGSHESLNTVHTDHERREKPEYYGSLSRNERRRRNRRNSHGEPAAAASQGLKVTVDRNERHVNVSGTRDKLLYEKSSSDEVYHPGGLLHLPLRNPSSAHQARDEPDVGLSRSHHMKNPYAPDADSEHHLYDPKNPNKPIVITNSKLAFQDTGDRNTPPQEHHPIHQPPPLHPPPHPAFFPGPYGYPAIPYPPYPGGLPPPPFVYGFQMPYKECVPFQDDAYAKDPYYHSGYDPDQAVAGRSRSQRQAKAEQILRDVQPLDNQLSNLLSRRIGGEDGWRRIKKLREELRVRYEQVVFLDPDVANKHYVENLLWKSVYYQVIEVFRRHLADETEDEVKGQLHDILNEGSEYYEHFLGKLQSTYNFSIDDFLDPNHPASDNLSRSIKLALLSAQRVYINLGDIARYRELANDTSNYGRARSYYIKAQQIAPKNGRPYNQLAILAMYTRRKLDAVYFYMRSLAASNPFLTARESLMSVFEDVRKKNDAQEKKRLAVKEELHAATRQTKKKPSPRVEIWVCADGTSTKDQVTDDKEDLSVLSAIELNKRFVLSFLNVHGKLFTKIGMEVFPESSCLMLREFQALIKHSPAVISSTRLLQLMAINMFAIENTALKDSSLESSCRSLHQDYAVQLGLDMFALLVVRCTALLEAHLASPEYPTQLLNEDLHQLMPGVKVWTDWMTCHAHLWNPPPSVRPPDLGLDVDVWKSCADFCNCLTRIDTSSIKTYRAKRPDCDPVVLAEDTMMAGFIPMLSAPLESSYVQSTVDKEVTRDCIRIEKLQLFREYLCGIDPPMLSYNVQTKMYFSVVVANTESEKKPDDVDGHFSELEDVVVESDDDVDAGDIEADHVSHLRARKLELKKKVEEQRKLEENAKAIVDENRHHVIELEIHPIFLVPDTNCFIDHLDPLCAILQSKKFTLVIPLVVINELDGLAKGSREGQYDSPDHAWMVKQCAKQAVAFLEAEFEKKNSHLRAQTSKGSTLETIAFRSEETSKSGNNDDLILSCCTHYCKDKANVYMNRKKDTPVRLYRDVVLLTDDRNLRLKALSVNVPVKDIPSFMRWSKVT
ncbi:telomerase-binding protein EST1A-like [Gigantopelta aegis]|uniref:telomerase-binding protein EST1A-like n=1 Tax=Gigantopelta aegis TaxID=1735272 RepID=UPI001B88C9B1|nr:telomerase-binding protein EST1A-like [Gigantopelta aegis]